MDRIRAFLFNPRDHDGDILVTHVGSMHAYHILCNEITRDLKKFAGHDTDDLVMDNNKPDNTVVNEKYRDTFAEWVFHDNNDKTKHYRLRIQKYPFSRNFVTVTLHSLQTEIAQRLQGCFMGVCIESDFQSRS